MASSYRLPYGIFASRPAPAGTGLHAVQSSHYVRRSPKGQPIGPWLRRSVPHEWIDGEKAFEDGTSVRRLDGALAARLVSAACARCSAPCVFVWNRRDALLDMVRAVNATLDPGKIAELIVDRASTWVPAPSWALVSVDQSAQLTVLAERGFSSGQGSAVFGVAAWVMDKGEEFATADLAHDSRVTSDLAASVVAFPLSCRGRRIGALISFDPLPSSKEPKIPSPMLRSIKVLLEPAAVALDNSLLLKRTEALSVTDDLTRLYNSRYLNLVLRRETKRASRSGRPLSLLFIDLDGFKAVNDNHGHLCGSRALVEAAAVIRGALERRTSSRGLEATSLPSSCRIPAEKARFRLASASWADCRPQVSVPRRPQYPPHRVGWRGDSARRRGFGRRTGAEPPTRRCQSQDRGRTVFRPRALPPIRRRQSFADRRWSRAKAVCESIRGCTPLHVSIPTGVSGFEHSFDAFSVFE